MLEGLLALALNSPAVIKNNSTNNIIQLNAYQYTKGPTLPIINTANNIQVPKTKDDVKFHYTPPNTFSITISTKYVHIKIAPQFYTQKQNPLIGNAIPYNNK